MTSVCAAVSRGVLGKILRGTYTDVGEDGIDEGEREPSLIVPVCKCGDILECLLDSLVGVTSTLLLDVMCRNSTPLFEAVLAGYSGQFWFIEESNRFFHIRWAESGDEEEDMVEEQVAVVGTSPCKEPRRNFKSVALPFIHYSRGALVSTSDP